MIILKGTEVDNNNIKINLVFLLTIIRRVASS